MYLYQLGYYSYEDSCYHELSHEKEFTQEEYEKMFIEATIDVLINKREKHHWLGHYEEGGYSQYSVDEYNDGTYREFTDDPFPTLEAFLERHGNIQWTHLSDIHDEITNSMIELYGFADVVYQAKIASDGWGGIVDKDRDFGGDEEILNRIMIEFWKRKS